MANPSFPSQFLNPQEERAGTVAMYEGDNNRPTTPKLGGGPALTQESADPLTSRAVGPNTPTGFEENESARTSASSSRGESTEQSVQQAGRNHNNEGSKEGLASVTPVNESHSSHQYTKNEHSAGNTCLAASSTIEHTALPKTKGGRVIKPQRSRQLHVPMNNTPTPTPNGRIGNVSKITSVRLFRHDDTIRFQVSREPAWFGIASLCGHPLAPSWLVSTVKELDRRGIDSQQMVESWRRATEGVVLDPLPSHWEVERVEGSSHDFDLKDKILLRFKPSWEVLGDLTGVNERELAYRLVGKYYPNRLQEMFPGATPRSPLGNRESNDSDAENATPTDNTIILD